MASPHRLLWTLALGSRSRPGPASALYVTRCQKFLQEFKYCGRKQTSHSFSRSLARSLVRALSLSLSNTHTHTNTHTEDRQMQRCSLFDTSAGSNCCALLSCFFLAQFHVRLARSLFVSHCARALISLSLSLSLTHTHIQIYTHKHRHKHKHTTERETLSEAVRRVI